jgi:hypothetical protein
LEVNILSDALTMKLDGTNLLTTIGPICVWLPAIETLFKYKGSCNWLLGPDDIDTCTKSRKDEPSTKVDPDNDKIIDLQHGVLNSIPLDIISVKLVVALVLDEVNTRYTTYFVAGVNLENIKVDWLFLFDEETTPWLKTDAIETLDFTAAKNAPPCTMHSPSIVRERTAVETSVKLTDDESTLGGATYTVGKRVGLTVGRIDTLTGAPVVTGITDGLELGQKVGFENVGFDVSADDGTQLGADAEDGNKLGDDVAASLGIWDNSVVGFDEGENVGRSDGA